MNNLSDTDLQVASMLLLGIIVILLFAIISVYSTFSKRLKNSEGTINNYIEHNAVVMEKKRKEYAKLRKENSEVAHTLKLKQELIEELRERIGRLADENKVIGELRAHNFELATDIRKASEEMSNQWINSISHAITTTDDYSKLAAKLNTVIHDYILVQHDLTQTKENK